jgi:exosortase
LKKILSSTTGKRILAALSLVTVWAIAVRQLSLEWTVNSLYQYGWWVIPLAAYLFYERIIDAPPSSKTSKSPIFLGLWICLTLLYIPFRIVEEANFDWILLNWFVAFFAISVTFYLLQQSGGKAWLYHFSFPILFVISAVPWPVPFENFILQNLMRINAEITASVISLGSMEAVARGNIIEISGQLIGVEEACSGIRSLQTSLMMSLFLGEFYRIKRIDRVWLLLLSFFLSFLFNTCRTIALTYIGATEGLISLESWHDPLGYGVLIISLSGLWSTAYWFSLKKKAASREEQSGRAWISQIQLNKSVSYMSIVFLFTVLAGEGMTAYWYQTKEKDLLVATDFSVQFPEAAKFYRVEEFSDITKKILKFNRGKSASWETNSGDQLGAYLLEWEPQRVSSKLVSAHTPEICYPAAGYHLETYLGIQEM